MSIKIGLYDVFAYTIPGGFYLLTMLYFLSTCGIIAIDFNIIKDYSAWLIIIAIMLAYLLGLLFDPLASVIYGWLFRKPSSADVIERFKKKHPDIEFNINLAYTPILLAYVKYQSSDLGDRVERAGATKTMFRNFGINFFALAIILLVQSYKSSNCIILIIASIFSLGLSILASKEFHKWNRWYQQMTYECAIAISLDKMKIIQLKK